MSCFPRLEISEWEKQVRGRLLDFTHASWVRTLLYSRHSLPRKANRRGFLAASAAGLGLLIAITHGANAEKKYSPGATDTEIKIGNVMPYSGSLSAYAVIGRVHEAYFRMINEQGGINGRKLTFISYDDGYNPAKTVEQTRKLVESDEVLMVASTLGTPTNSAIQRYLNIKHVPQLFVGSGASKWNDPQNFPWTIGFGPSNQIEARIYAKYILKEKPDGKIAVLYQNDDYGKDYLKGLKDGLGDNAVSMIVAEDSYDTSEPTMDSHIVKFKAAGADIFVDVTTSKFAAQAIRKMAEIGWKPMHILNNPGTSVSGVMKPAGFENSQGVISAAYLKDAADPQWADDPGMKKFLAFLDKYAPDVNKFDGLAMNAYGPAQTIVQVLQQCGDDLTRENVMRQVASLKDFQPDSFLPGITITTSPTDFAPVKQLRLMHFHGERWELFGDVVGK
jgi:ABC-type branched-subunit amino acid transport system substrate-binding protein